VVNFKIEKIGKTDLTKLDLYTPEDILAMLKASLYDRDKAIVSVLWESAGRASEVIDMKIKDCNFDEYGVSIRVSGKTGTRKVRLVDSTPYLKKWINNHPHKDDPESDLWISLRKMFGTKLTYNRVYQLVESIKSKAGIKKKSGLHLFRHSRLDYLGKKGFRERDLRIIAGWTMDSKMSDTYLHYDEEEVNNKVLEMHGLSKKKKDKQDKVTLEPLTCIICGRENPTDSKVCECGALLNRDITKKTNDSFRDDVKELNELFKDPHFIDFYKNWKRMKIEKS